MPQISSIELADIEELERIFAVMTKDGWVIPTWLKTMRENHESQKRRFFVKYLKQWAMSQHTLIELIALILIAEFIVTLAALHALFNF